MIATPYLLDYALRVHRQLHAVEVGGLLDVPGSTCQRIPPRDLTPAERSVRLASLELMRNVLTGEIDVAHGVPPRGRSSNASATVTPSAREESGN